MKCPFVREPRVTGHNEIGIPQFDPRDDWMGGRQCVQDRGHAGDHRDRYGLAWPRRPDLNADDKPGVES